MSKKFIVGMPIIILSLILPLLLAACGSDTTSSVSATVAALPAPSQPISYAKDIDPILQNSCFNCHGGERTSKALSVATYDTLMKGSQNGAVVVAGDPGKSKLLQSVLSGKMPKKGDKLTPEQVQLIQLWIEEGAQNN